MLDILKGKRRRQPWVYDLECYPNLFTAVFKHSKEEKKEQFVIYTDMEDKAQSINQLPMLVEFLQKDVDTLIGYNNHEYDDLMLKHMLASSDIFMRMGDPKEFNESMKNMNDRLINRSMYVRAPPDKYINHLKSLKYFNSVDLMALFNLIDRASLKQIAINLKWPNILDLPFSVNKAISQEEVKKVVIYNANDVDITKRLLEYKRVDIAFRKALSIAYGVNMLNSNDTNIAKAIIRKFYCEETKKRYEDFKGLRTNPQTIHLKNCISKKIKFQSYDFNKLLNYIRNKSVPAAKASEQANSYTELGKVIKKPDDVFRQEVHTKYLSHTVALGGLHSDNYSEELIETDEFSYIDADVEAYYPMIVVNDRLYPKHLGPEFTKVYEQKIVKKRFEVKDLIKKGIDVYDNKTIDASLKITANSTFGLTKSKHSWLYDPNMTTFICISGEMYLLMLIERLEELSDCVVVYSNTDGITTRVPKGSEADYYRICSQWMEYTGFNLEFIKYRRMIMQDINSYLMVKENGSTKAKGKFIIDRPITKGYSNPIVAKALNEYYINNVPIKDTIRNEKDIFMFIRAQRVSQVKFKVQFMPKQFADEQMMVDNHKDKVTPQTLLKTNRWVVTRGNPKEGKLTKESLPHERKMTIAEVNAHNRGKAPDDRMKMGETIFAPYFDKFGKPAITNLQKGRLVTLVNDIKGCEDVSKMHLDYDFYEKECYDIIKQIKPYTGERKKNVRAVQTTLM